MLDYKLLKRYDLLENENKEIINIDIEKLNINDIEIKIKEIKNIINYDLFYKNDYDIIIYTNDYNNYKYHYRNYKIILNNDKKQININFKFKTNYENEKNSKIMLSFYDLKKFITEKLFYKYFIFNYKDSYFKINDKKYKQILNNNQYELINMYLRKN